MEELLNANTIIVIKTIESLELFNSEMKNFIDNKLQPIESVWMSNSRRNRGYRKTDKQEMLKSS